ncbi:MAG: hypothetical protein JWQ89_1028 [Devosia sp.]|uniref:GDSL-type esterase/lipase family protein n=1 Tax=Devosia sp. TaxID=1871048 RepID=UPI00261EDEAE|nr:GDSL-type esterase/lipase family protein [Devosia sp.]MDB5539301.1 hypothetical protein [Devosia sp.]
MGEAGAAALGLGMGLSAPRRGSGWAHPGAILDADFTGGRFVFAGRNYADKPTFLSAIGGVEASGVISIGPYVAPDAPELLSNGDFAGGTTGWTATQSAGGPATGAVVGGEYVLSGNGANSPFVGQPVSVARGHAYKARARIKGGPSATIYPFLWITPNSSGGGFMGANGGQNASTSYAESAGTFTPVGAATTMYVGMRAIYNPANGTVLGDDFSCKECTPFAGFVPAAISGVIEATTPAVAGGNKVLWQIDDDARDGGTPTERNYIRLYWDAGKHLHLLVTNQASIGSTTTQADLDLGVIDVSTAFRVAFSAAPNSFVASLDGQPALTDSSGSFPGAAAMRIGRGQTTSNNWNGSVARVTLFPAATSAEEVENLSAASIASLVAAWGDSLTVGNGATTAAAKYPAVAAAAFAPDRAVANRGVGGDTSTQIRTRFLADSTLRRRTAWIWAGRNNYSDPTTVKADIAAMVAALPHTRFLVAGIPNGNYATEYLGQPGYNAIIALNADLAALYGPRYVNVRGALVAAANPVTDATDIANDVVPGTLRSDNIHLNDAGYATVAAAFKAANDAMGW